MEHLFYMRNSLFTVIELLSDEKSFSLDLDTNFWALAQFKDHGIIRQALNYRYSPSYYQHPTTTYPLRKLRKQFGNLAEIITYFNTQNKTLERFDLTFDNGLRVRKRTLLDYNFYAPSTAERDALIARFIAMAGFDALDINQLVINCSYYLSYSQPPKVLLEECPIGPDEFWSEEAVEAWRKKYRKLYSF
jgi:hypothetical protein